MNGFIRPVACDDLDPRLLLEASQLLPIADGTGPSPLACEDEPRTAPSSNDALKVQAVIVNASCSR